MTTTTSRFFLLVALTTLASLATACSGGGRSSGTIGPAGGTVSSPSGISLSIPAGALSQTVDLRIVELTPGQGAMARIQLEPRGTALAWPATLSFKVEDGNVRVAEVEHGAEGEVRHALANQRHDAQGEVEVELEHLTEIELEHGATCDAACGTGFECDDGVCQADDNGLDDPATPGAPADPSAPAPVDDHGQHPAGHP